MALKILLALALIRSWVYYLAHSISIFSILLLHVTFSLLQLSSHLQFFSIPPLLFVSLLRSYLLLLFSSLLQFSLPQQSFIIPQFSILLPFLPLQLFVLPEPFFALTLFPFLMLCVSLLPVFLPVPFTQLLA